MAEAVYWENLPYDLVREIAESFLATEDFDYYVAFQAVCGNWRRATDSTADATDPKFMPSKWILLEHSIHDGDDRVTFFNLSTGRLLRKKIPKEVRSRRHFFVGVTKGGLFVLGQRAQPYQTRVLNPFTGAMVRFKAQIPVEEVNVVVLTTSPMMVFVSNLQNACVMWADQSSKEGWGPSFGEGQFRAGDFFQSLRSMTYFAGDVYVTDNHGSIMSTSDVDAGNQGQRSAGSITMATTIQGPTVALAGGRNVFYLVESDGKLLLVMNGRVCKGFPAVYKVDTVNKVLVPVRSIGRRALFVSSRRSLSIDTTNTKFRSVEAGSIYYADYSMIRAYDYESITGGGWEGEPKYAYGFGLAALEYCEPPFSLAQLLADYCRTIEYSELQMLPPYGEEGYTD